MRDSLLSRKTALDLGDAPGEGKPRPFFFASAFGFFMFILTILGGLGLLAFFIALVTSGSFVLWGIETLLRLAGA